MIDLIMTINSVQESSKSELSSGIFGHVKVWLNFVFVTLILHWNVEADPEAAAAEKVPAAKDGNRRVRQDRTHVMRKS